MEEEWNNTSAECVISMIIWQKEKKNKVGLVKKLKMAIHFLPFQTAANQILFLRLKMKQKEQMLFHYWQINWKINAGPCS